MSSFGVPVPDRGVNTSFKGGPSETIAAAAVVANVVTLTARQVSAGVITTVAALNAVETTLRLPSVASLVAAGRAVGDHIVLHVINGNTAARLVVAADVGATFTVYGNPWVAANGGHVRLDLFITSATAGNAVVSGVTRPTPTTAITAARTLHPEESGLAFGVTLAAAPYQVTLPTPAAGLEYTLLLETVAAGGNLTVTDGAAHLTGLGFFTDGVGPVAYTALAGTTLTCVGAQLLEGDWVSFIGIDSTHWIVSTIATNAAAGAPPYTIA